MKTTKPTSTRPIVWKSRSTNSHINYDEEMQHLVGIIKSGNEDHLLRWIEVCNGVNMTDSGGNTVLHWASSLGNLTAVTRLLLAGADAKAENHIRATPLHCAAIGGYSAVIEQLLRYGADAMAKNIDGQTMFDLLRHMGWESLSILYNHLEDALLSASQERNSREYITFTREASLGALCSPVVRGESPLTTSHLSLESHSETNTNRVHGFCSTTLSETEILREDEWNECLWILALELLCSDEARARQELVNEYLDWALQVVTDTLPPPTPSPPPPPPLDAAVSQNVEAVLGERYAKGSRVLLVQLQHGSILWVAEEEVANEAVVKEYTDRLNYANTMLQSPPSNTNSNRHTNHNGIHCMDSFYYAERLEYARRLSQRPHGCRSSPPLGLYSPYKKRGITPQMGSPQLCSPQQEENFGRDPFASQHRLKIEHQRQDERQQRQEEQEQCSQESSEVNSVQPDLAHRELSHKDMKSTLAYPSTSDGVDAAHGGFNFPTVVGEEKSGSRTNGGNYPSAEHNVTEEIHTTKARRDYGHKPSTLRQKLSHDEEVAYNVFLRESALRYLRRKAEGLGPKQ